MSKPLKIAFLWHQHQPDYFDGKKFIMPWVRLHAVKDYYDLPNILEEFPKVRQTFNIVPSMIKQLEMYIEGIKDEVQILSEKSPSSLSDNEKEKILTLFFRCQKENMIFKYPRYKELYDKSKTENPLELFTHQDWLDLQVWYNLTWLGQYSRQSIPHLFEKGKNFTELEKQSLLDEHINIIKKVTQKYADLQKSGQAEITISPYYHPILPLLIDTDSAHEAQDYIHLPTPPFKFPTDADLQIKTAQNYVANILPKQTQGMWCSEGAISDTTLNLLMQNNIKWTATDEEVLLYSGENLVETDKYFPHNFSSSNGEVTIFFRDNLLSDKIGFTYQNMNTDEAVADFISSLRKIRDKITEQKGEKALDNAVVSVILDGENCWEYYPNNGLDFLRALYTELEKYEFETVKFSDCLASDKHNLTHVRAGSWINANFDIWIGSEQAKVAWELLAEARITLEFLRETIEPEKYNSALTHLMKAEGSDWFWWYCPYHKAENERDFDILFRKNIENAYLEIGLDIPENVMQAIIPDDSEESHIIRQKLQDENFDYNNLETWGFTIPNLPQNTVMHKISNRIEKMYFAKIGSRYFFKIKMSNLLTKHEKITLDLGKGSISISKNSINSENIHIQEIKYQYGNTLILEVTSADISEDSLNIRVQKNDILEQDFDIMI